MADWFYMIQDSWKGPIDEQEIQKLVHEMVITPDTLISNGKGQSAVAKNVTGIVWPTPTRALPPKMAQPTPQSTPAPLHSSQPFSQSIPQPLPPPASHSSTAINDQAGQVHYEGGNNQAMPAAGNISRRVGFVEAFVQIPAIAITNISPLLTNILLFMAVAWIPWINLGAFIGIHAISCKLTSVGTLRNTEILDVKYRYQLSNFMILMWLMICGAVTYFFMSLTALYIPLASFPLLLPFLLTGDGPSAIFWVALVALAFFCVCSFFTAYLSLLCGWLLAPLLVFDKGLAPSEALAKSTELMNGNRLTFCVIWYVFMMLFSPLLGVCGLLGVFIHPSVGFLGGIGLVVLFLAILLSCFGFFYGKLTEDME